MEFLSVTATGWSAITVASSMSVLAGLMFVLGSKKMHRIWGIFSVTVAVWAGAFYGVTLANDPETAIFWWKISFIGLILNPFLFFHFVLEFIDNPHINRIKLYMLSILYIVAAVFLFINITTDLIIKDVTFLFGDIYYNTPPGTLHPYFMSIFGILVIFAHYLVYREYRKRDDDVFFRQRTTYFFIATLIAYVGGGLNFLPVYGIEVSPVTSMAVAFGSMIIGYAILRYRLFNARVVTAQLLTFILMGFALFRLIISTSTGEILFNTTFLLVTLFVGIYLIISVRNEVEQREELTIANKQLERLNLEKSEFLSIATHQLKAPLTVIRGYTSMLTEGSYGALTEKAKEVTNRVFDSASSLVVVIDDYLNVSRIDQGRMKYDFGPVDLVKLVAEINNDLQNTAEHAKISLSNEIKCESDAMITADVGKLRQIIFNNVDNAIKYTDAGGWVKISLVKPDDTHYRIEISDNGIGMSQETIKKLFKRFSRAKDIGKSERAGTGLGLYIAQEMVKAHGGRLWAESAGKGMGSTFIIELAVKPPDKGEEQHNDKSFREDK